MAMKLAMATSTSELLCYKMEAVFEHNVNLLDAAVNRLRRNKPECQNLKDFLDELRSDHQKLSGLIDIADKIQQVCERDQHKEVWKMNPQKDWTHDVGFACIMGGLLWCFMLGSIGLVLGVFLIVIGLCNILRNYVLPKNKQ
ncbi:hypothetical protein [Lacticaseibacillus jixiensis]|uniref:hypothetical protein n=1 Tax=Lacticaseibacillus jixiensis TaxID=3231926 RepID=UPI0036F2E38A